MDMTAEDIIQDEPTTPIGEAEKPGVTGSEEPKVDVAEYYYMKRQLAKLEKQKNSQPTEEDQPQPGYVTREELDTLLGGYGSTIREQQVERYLSKHPELSPYKDKAMKWWNHESRRHLPFETVLLEAAGPQELMKIGAKIAQDSASQAELTRSGGTSSVRPHSSGGKFTSEQILNMSPADFKKNFPNV